MSLLRLLLNVVWIVAGGIWMAAGWLVAAVLLAARWIGLRARALPVIGVLGLGGFLVLARPEPSVLRATLMGLLVVEAMVRRGASARSGLPALCAAVLVLVLAALDVLPGVAQVFRVLTGP